MPSSSLVICNDRVLAGQLNYSTGRNHPSALKLIDYVAGRNDLHLYLLIFLTIFSLQGMGGQLNYFSLWLADEYGKGHSMAKPLGTTYHSPQLSAEPHFEFSDLQVWRCSNIQEDEEAEEEAREKVK